MEWIFGEGLENYRLKLRGVFGIFNFGFLFLNLRMVKLRF